LTIQGQVQIDPRLRQGGDEGLPLVLSDPEAPAAQQIAAVAQALASKSRGLAGRRLGLTPA
jgi:ATP-binding protein involved in chromosome partitioning